MRTTEKTCFRCGATKPLTDFYRHQAMADGHLGKCKDCTKGDVSQNYRARLDHYTAYERKRFADPERKAKARQYAIKRPTEKRRAHYLTSNAIRDGRLIRQPCEKCGEEKSEAHHDDYTKPLEVRWLCRRHHLEHHGKEYRKQA